MHSGGCCATNPCDVEVKSVFEVLGLRDDHQVKTPAAAEVCDDNGVDRPRRQKRFPRSLERLRHTTPHHTTSSTDTAPRMSKYISLWGKQTIKYFNDNIANMFVLQSCIGHIECFRYFAFNDDESDD